MAQAGSEQSLYSWEQYPQQMYNQTKGVPELGRNPYQSWQANQFAPMYAAWNLQSMLYPNETPESFRGPEGFYHYIQSYPTALNRWKLGNMYDNYAARSPQFQYQMMDALGRDIFDQMLYGRLQQSYAPAVASYYASQRPTLESAWNVSDEMMNNGNFMNYLMGRMTSRGY